MALSQLLWTSSVPLGLRDATSVGASLPAVEKTPTFVMEGLRVVQLWRLPYPNWRP